MLLHFCHAQVNADAGNPDFSKLANKSPSKYSFGSSNNNNLETEGLETRIGAHNKLYLTPLTTLFCH